MVFNLFRRIIKTGLQNTVPILQYRQILITNYLTFFCICGALFMSLMTFLFGHHEYATACLAGSTLYLFVFYFNHSNRYKIATVYFMTISILMVTALYGVSVIYELSIGSEYLLIAALAIYLLLFDGKKKNYIYWLFFLFLVSIQVARLEYIGQEIDDIFALLILNLFFTAWFLFLFLSFFKSILLRAVEKTNSHERTLYSLIDNVPIFMALVDKSGTYRIANKHYAEQFGLEKDDIIGKKRSKVLPGNILENHSPYYNKAMEGEPISFLEKNEMPRGDSMFSRGKYVPIYNEEEIESMAIYVDDVSELIEVEESLKRANETKDKLFSIIAHDIRSPLNLFQSILNVSEDEMISKEEFFTYQKELKNRLRSLSERLDELLDWARMQLGGINAYPSKVEINAVVQENVELFKTLIEKKKIDFQTELGEDLCGWVDENHLRIAVRNLIHNSIKYSDNESSIKVNTKEEGEFVFLEIQDSGTGMSSDTVNAIMKKELQKSVIGTSGEVGTGLGLSLSLGLLEKNKCEISVISELGKGTSFQIRIPKGESVKD